MLSPARAMASAQKVILCKVFSSVQKRIFTEKVVFRHNINCKPFYLIFKDFSKLSLYINKTLCERVFGRGRTTGMIL